MSENKREKKFISECGKAGEIKGVASARGMVEKENLAATKHQKWLFGQQYRIFAKFSRGGRVAAVGFCKGIVESTQLANPARRPNLRVSAARRRLERGGRQMELSTNHRLFGPGGGAAAEDYQERRGRYADYGDGDHIETIRSGPPGCRPEWLADPGAFWSAADSHERTHALKRFSKADESGKAWIVAHAEESLDQVLSVVPPELLSGDRRTDLEAWIAAQGEGWEQGAGRALKKSPMIVKLRVIKEKDGSYLHAIAKTRGEWMAEEGQVGMKGRVSIDNRLSQDQVKQLCADFRKRLNARGLYCSTSIHWKPGNHHIHFTMSMRAIDEHGNFSKGRVIRDPKELSRFEKANREFCAEWQNKALLEMGLEPTVESKTYKDRGLSKEPISGTHKEVNTLTEKRLLKEKKWLDEALKNPSVAIDKITETKEIFTYDDLLYLLKRSGLDESDAETLAQNALKSDKIKIIGLGLFRENIYTSHIVDAMNRRLITAAKALGERPVQGDYESASIDAALPRTASREQSQAARMIDSATGLINLSGAAGSGKTSTTIAAVAAATVAAGGRIKARAPTGAAALVLGAELGITDSTTAASDIVKWRAIEDIKEQLRTGRLTENGRALLEYNLKKLKKTHKTSKITSAIADAEAMLASGVITDKHRQYLTQSLETRIAALDIQKGDKWLLDEAGLADTKTVLAILEKAVETETDVILSGDTMQYASAGAGSPVRLLEELGLMKSAKISEIFRQQHDEIDCLMLRDGLDLSAAASAVEQMSSEEKSVLRRLWLGHAKKAGPSWQAAASMELSRHDVRGLARYLEAGRLRWAETRSDAIALVAKKVAENQSDVIAISTQRKTVAAINDLVKQELRNSGKLKAMADGFEVDTLDNEDEDLGRLRFQVGDRIVFLKNENKGDIVCNIKDSDHKGVRNGSLGTIIRAEDGQMFVRLDALPGESAGRQVVFDPNKYKNIAHGWAITGLKSQGATKKKTVALLDEYTRIDGVYVQGTRHRDEIEFVSDKETFYNEDDLLRSCGRENIKPMVMDYDYRSDADKKGFDIASEYLMAEKAASELFRNLNKEAKSLGLKVYELAEFKKYEDAKAEIKPFALKVCENLGDCARWLKIGGSSAHLAQVAAGQVQKVYSPATEKLREKMREYAGMVEKARDLWNSIKSEARGADSKLHRDYGVFSAARDGRNALAVEIVREAAYSRHCVEIGISSAMIQRHAQPGQRQEPQPVFKPAPAPAPQTTKPTPAPAPAPAPVPAPPVDVEEQLEDMDDEEREMKIAILMRAALLYEKDQKFKEAREKYYAAGKAGSLDAYIRFGKAHEAGDLGLPKDTQKAMLHYERAGAPGALAAKALQQRLESEAALASDQQRRSAARAARAAAEANKPDHDHDDDHEM